MIFSPNHSCPFLKHVHTILTYVAVLLGLVSLKSLHVNLSVSLTPHIHPIILISDCWSINSFLHWPCFTAM